MENALTTLLQDFSSQFPLLWALLVMAVMAGTALGLHFLWGVVLRWIASAWAGGRG